MKTQNFFLLVAPLLVLGGCANLNNMSGNATGDVTSIQYNLPSQVQWSAVQDTPSMKVFVPKVKGVIPQNSPITVVYRQASNVDAAALADKLLKSFRASCYKTKDSIAQTASIYPNKAHFESVCNRVKDNNKQVGRFNSGAIFTGKQHSYLLLVEIKTPTSDVPGKFISKTPAIKKRVENATAMIAAAQKMVAEALACDATGKCR